MKAKLSGAYYGTLLADNGADAVRLARRERPDMVILDAQMPGLDGFAVCERLKTDPATAHIPVIMVTAYHDAAAKLRGLEAGADDFLTKPVNDQALLARVRNLMREKTMIDELRMRSQTCRNLGLGEGAGPAPHPPRPARIRIVDRTARRAAARAAALRRVLPTALVEGAEPAALLAAGPGAAPPDLLLIAMDPAGRQRTLDLLAELRSRPATRHAAYIVVLPDDDAASAVSVLDVGANDYVSADAGIDEIAVRIRTQIRRKRYSDRLRDSVQDGLRLAVTDPLTGLYNRRYAMNHLGQIAARAAETGRSFAVMLLDIDHFKQVNDRHGHAAGDAVLAGVAGRMRDNLRGVDLLARFGGEEFVAALPDTTLEEARIAAERLRAVVAEAPFDPPGPAAAPISVTLSVGVALGQGAETPVAALLEEADRALYVSKSDGRNLVSFGRPAA
jgi:two-component system cell cycle response regulator